MNCQSSNSSVKCCVVYSSRSVSEAEVVGEALFTTKIRRIRVRKLYVSRYYRVYLI